MDTPKPNCRTAGVPVWARLSAEGLILHLHIQPGAKLTKLVGEHGQRLKVALQAPPVDGKANEALIAFLAKQLGLAKSRVRLTSGETSREKSVAITLGDLPATDVLDRLTLG